VRERPSTPLRIPEIFDRLRAEIEQAPLAHKDRHRTNLEKLAAGAPAGSAVLEVGAAPCHFTAALAEAGYAVKAVDLDPRRIADFATRFGVEVVECDIESEPLPFADGSFRYVVCAETYEHLRRDLFFAKIPSAASGPRPPHLEEVDLSVGRQAPEGDRIVWGVARGGRRAIDAGLCRPPDIAMMPTSGSCATGPVPAVRWVSCRAHPCRAQDEFVRGGSTRSSGSGGGADAARSGRGHGPDTRAGSSQ